MDLKKLSLTILIVTLTVNLFAQYKEYDSLTYMSSLNDTLFYRQLNPQQIVEGEKYPLVLFLHGAGERGTDNISQLTNGGLMFTNPVNRKNFPAFVLFPQCPTDLYWPTPKRPDGFQQEKPFPLDAEISKPLALTKELLDKVIESYPIDESRIYILGLSMGGMGTFDMICRYPDLFAAAVPICGGINTERLNGFESETAIRIYHGDADSVVPVRFSREAYIKLEAEGANVEYIEFPGVNHNSWDPAFNTKDFLEWIFQQKKK